MRQRKNRKLIRFDSATKIVNISEHDLEFNSRTLYFLRIIRHLADESFDKQIVSTFATADLGALEEVIGNLDDLFAANPTKSVALITVLSSRLNDISDDFVNFTCYFAFFFKNIFSYVRRQEKPMM